MQLSHEFPSQETSAGMVLHTFFSDDVAYPCVFTSKVNRLQLVLNPV